MTRSTTNRDKMGLGYDFRTKIVDSIQNDRVKGIITLLPISLFIFIVYFLPIFILFILSFSTTSTLADFQFTFEHYIQIFNPDALFSFQLGELLYLGLLFKSLRTSLVITVISIAISYPITYYIGNKVNPDYRLPLVLLVMVPFWTSYLVRTYSWIPILAENGVINGVLTSLGFSSLQLLYTSLATNVGLVYLHLPFMILPLYASMVGLDSSQLEAAKDLGATRWNIFREIVFPLTAPGLLAGTILVFIKTTAAYVVPTLLGGANGILYMSVVVNQFRQTYNWNLGAALSFVLLGVILVLVVIAQKSGVSLSDIQMG